MWYMNNEPENYKRTWKALDASKYVAFRLTGVPAIDRPTAMIFAPYYDYKKGIWSDEMNDIVGGGLDKLPEIYECHDVIGHISNEGARETGLKSGTPVVASGPDAITSAYSVGMVNTGESCFMYGTTGCWFTVLDKPIVDPRLLNSIHVVKGKYIVAGAMIATGGLVKWFRDKFGHIEKSMGEMLKVSSYQLLDQEAEKVNPGSNGLLVLPYFMGERTPIWDVNAKGMIFGLTLDHSRAHVYRSLLEAGGYGLRQHMDIARSSGVDVKNMLAVNGGARSKLWRQIISDITGVSQDYVTEVLGAPFGDAFLAGMGAGVFKRFEDIKNYVHIGERTQPNMKNHELYSRLYKIYLKLYDHTKEDSDALSQIYGE
jgi:xylulokinase